MKKENFNRYYLFLAKIPFFKNIDKSDLINFSNLMKINRYHKGEIINFNANKQARCYIVYEGLFKLSKIENDGNEVVINIAGKTDIVSPMHFSKHYDVSAQFIKKTTLFYFDKKDIDKFVISNHQFALNNIEFLANNMQKLMINAAILKLKNAKEKVGWYLLYAGINTDFKLPYSKSLIAAYLGIKPESFSRALIKLKKEGIELKNKTILLNSGRELCKYCDKVTGSDCADFLSSDCIHKNDLLG